ncbi:MAG: PA2169 family four-helix-bundle protein [Acidobacteria bacterium]|nr:MAG: PA2169 family four-helix-bundle protein [Acidobacteriota bacterium]REK01547.1 MAG: PA2169 family four-helix-bundle protein [Acidobacteriota bacterium]REK14503.1 MAG: PA2169 family four-helix-bundle protein [Acidobacteriota bacterium]REK45218.1 MAG: PA2169 family four-helix-bundle protein [Acidobacteriota bacterium]
MMEKDKIIEKVNELIQTNKDSEEGFKTAAASVEDNQTTALFEELSNQRGHFARELQDMVQQFGGEPAESGTFSGTLKRGWMNIKTAVTSDDKTAVLNECERAEDVAKEAYEDAMKSRLPESVSDVVSRQYHLVKAAHDRVKALRDRSRAAAG